MTIFRKHTENFNLQCNCYENTVIYVLSNTTTHALFHISASEQPSFIHSIHTNKFFMDF